MEINSVKFIKGAVKTGDMPKNNLPQVAFIGRSNAGKSSIINSLTGKRDLARTSSFPGRTQEINIFLINDSFYLIDLPGYGFAKASKEQQAKIEQMIFEYLFDSNHEHRKIVLVIDGNVGPTKNDLEMLYELEQAGKNIIIVANKIDKIKKSEYKKQLEKIRDLVGAHKIIPYSSEKKIGIKELATELLK